MLYIILLVHFSLVHAFSSENYIRHHCFNCIRFPLLISLRFNNPLQHFTLKYFQDLRLIHLLFYPSLVQKFSLQLCFQYDFLLVSVLPLVPSIPLKHSIQHRLIKYLQPCP